MQPPSKTPAEIQAQFESHVRDCFRTRDAQFRLLNLPMGALYSWRVSIFRAIQRGESEYDAYERGMALVKAHLDKINSKVTPDRQVSFRSAEEIVHTTATLATIIRNGGGMTNYHSLPAEFLADER